MTTPSQKVASILKLPTPWVVHVSFKNDRKTPPNGRTFIIQTFGYFNFEQLHSVKENDDSKLWFRYIGTEVEVQVWISKFLRHMSRNIGFPTEIVMNYEPFSENLGELLRKCNY